MAEHRLPALVIVLSAVAAGGCGSGGSTAPSASAECGDSGPVIALNRTEVDGLAEVVIAGSDGDVELVTGDWVATKPSFSPDGRRLVVVRADGDYESAGPGSTSLWIIGTDGTGQRAVTQGDHDDEPAWSPDGETIAFSQGTVDPRGFASRVAVVSSDGGDARPLLPSEGTLDLAPAWSPDGRQLAFIRADLGPDSSAGTTIWVVNADGRHPREVAQVPDAHSVEWHRDGETLLVSTFTAEDGTVWLVDLDTGTETHITDHATFAAWSPDGETIYYFSKDSASQASRWRLVEGRPVGDRLEHVRDVGRIEAYLYRHFGLAVGPCAEQPAPRGR